MLQDDELSIMPHKIFQCNVVRRTASDIGIWKLGENVLLFIILSYNKPTTRIGTFSCIPMHRLSLSIRCDINQALLSGNKKERKL